MFAFKHIQKSYNDKIILDDISLSVNSGEVIALIGENGVGKTTLLQIITGDTKPESGQVVCYGETIAYVPQEAALGLTIKSSFSKSTEAWRIAYALAQVGLEQKVGRTAVRNLSGGQKTRLAFATILARIVEPTILLLDEPTNNLDVEGLEWLEQFVKAFAGGILIVSHNREFINRVSTKIIELDTGALRQYGGNYDFYKQQKVSELQTARELYEKTIDERRRLQKAMAAQSEKSQHTHKHIARNDNDKYQRDFFRNRVTVKYGQQAKALAGRLDKINMVDKPDIAKNYQISLHGGVDSSKLILRLESITKSYITNVLHGINLEIRGNERVHVTGANGNGKTTLLKIIAGLLLPDGGTVTHGTGVSIGYFSQDIDGLDHNKTALQNLQTAEVEATALYREARSLGLSKDDLQKPVSKLSRGQQAKLGIAKLLLDTHQLLIFDEPTNHLDIPTREQIESAIERYSGAIIFASHDTYFNEVIRPIRKIAL